MIKYRLATSNAAPVAIQRHAALAEYLTRGCVHGGAHPPLRISARSEKSQHRAGRRPLPGRLGERERLGGPCLSHIRVRLWQEKFSMLRTFRGSEALYGCAQEACGRGLRVRAILVPHGGVFGRRRASPAGGRTIGFAMRTVIPTVSFVHERAY